MDEDIPCIVSLDHTGTNPDTPPPSPMDWWQQSGAPAPQPALPEAISGSIAGGSIAGASSAPGDPIGIAKTMYDAYLNGLRDARHQNQSNLWAPPNPWGGPMPPYGGMPPQYPPQYPPHPWGGMPPYGAMAPPPFPPHPAMSGSWNAGYPGSGSPTAASLRSLGQHPQMNPPYNGSDAGRSGHTGVSGMTGLTAGGAPSELDAIVQKQMKEIENLRLKLENIETTAGQSTAPSRPSRPMCRPRAPSVSSVIPFAFDGKPTGAGGAAGLGLSGFGLPERDAASVIMSAARSECADTDYLGGVMTDLESVAKDPEGTHTGGPNEIDIDNNSEWTPLQRPQYYRLNITTIDRTHKILPHEPRMLNVQGTLVIAVTMYNEDWYLFNRTMKGVIQNLKPFVEHYGEKMLNKIVVVIVSDGRSKMDEECKREMIRHGFIDSRLDDDPESHNVHTFYNRFMLKTGVKAYGPLQVLTVIKEGNGGKLHSHKVLMHGFCMRIAPSYVFLLDCGTMPNADALFLLYDYMEREPTVGGCAGEIEAEPSWCNGVVMSQVFEYKVAHIFDKAAESMFGFVSVLPGAFSAYRYRALTDPDEETGKCPLDKYFDGLSGEYGPFESNIYLAEDRILGFELIARNGTSYSLKYIPGSVATTDVPQHVDDLLKQRKRWLNGALFALFYSFIHMKQFYTSGLPACRKLLITIEMSMLTLLTAINLVGLGMYYLLFKFVVFDVLISQPEELSISDSLGNGLAHALNFAFIFVLLIQVIFGLGNSQPTHIKIFYTITVLFFAGFQIIVLGFAAFFVTKQGWQTILLVLLGMGIYFLGAIFHQRRDILLIAASYPWYMLLTPLYVVVLPIRAFSNIHDISWGTKGLEDSTANARKQTFQRFRSVFILVWLLVNGAIVTVAIALQGPIEGFSDVLLKTAFYIAAGINGLRFLALLWIRVQGRWCLGARRVHDDAFRADDDAPPQILVHPQGADIPLGGPTLVKVATGLPSTLMRSTTAGGSVMMPPPGSMMGSAYKSTLAQARAQAYLQSYATVPSAPAPTPANGLRYAPGLDYEETNEGASDIILGGYPEASSSLGGLQIDGLQAPSLDRHDSAAELKKTRFAVAPSVIPASTTADYMAHVKEYLTQMNLAPTVE